MNLRLQGVGPCIAKSAVSVKKIHLIGQYASLSFRVCSGTGIGMGRKLPIFFWHVVQ